MPTKKKERAPEVLTCLKHMEEYDPEGARLATERVWSEFAEAAGVTVARLKLAYRRVAWDGYYGPVDDEAWEACDGEGMPMVDAKKILHAALDHQPDVRYTHPDVGCLCEGITHCSHPDHREFNDNGPLFHEEEITMDPEIIKRDCFRAIREIYGGWI